MRPGSRVIMYVDVEGAIHVGGDDPAVVDTMVAIIGDADPEDRKTLRASLRAVDELAIEELVGSDQAGADATGF